MCAGVCGLRRRRVACVPPSERTNIEFFVFPTEKGAHASERMSSLPCDRRSYFWSRIQLSSYVGTSGHDGDENLHRYDFSHSDLNRNLISK